MYLNTPSSISTTGTASKRASTLILMLLSDLTDPTSDFVIRKSDFVIDIDNCSVLPVDGFELSGNVKGKTFNRDKLKHSYI